MDNKYGCFSKDGAEFVIKRIDTPRPWINYLSNEKYCLLISQTGGGYSFYLDAERNRLTRWAPGNYLTNEPGRFLYLHDIATGDYWSATKVGRKFRCRHGLGYTVISSEYKKIETEITFFVPMDSQAEVWIVKLRNKGTSKCKLKVFPFVEWMPGNYFTDLSMRNISALLNRGEYDKKNETIFVTKYPWVNKQWPYEVFMATSLPVSSYDIDYESFLGRYGDYLNPYAVKKGMCSNSGKVMGVDMVGVLQSEVEIDPNQEKYFTVLAGVSKKRVDNLKIIKKYRNIEYARKSLQKTKNYWKDSIGENIQIETSDKDFDLSVNIWLKYQIFMNNHWGRSATFYHEGAGEFGYRNTAQDAWAMVSINPEYSLRRLLMLAEHQRKNGQPLPGWSLETGPTTHNPPSDFSIWLPMLLLAYVKETGNLKVLDKEIKFYDGGSGSLYEHARRAVMFLLNTAKSERGLPLMGTQDWNDAFDRTGILGKGESVWLGMGLCVALKNMQELSLAVKDKKTHKQCVQGYEKMKNLINKYGWDGNWYCYAFNDYGEPIGSGWNLEDKVQINAQTWAIMADLSDVKQLKSMLSVIDRELETPYGPVLFTPAYTKYNPRIGRITAFAPGTKENAAVFSHAGAFKIVADVKLGRAEEAYKTFKQLLPMSDNKDIETYKTEPYVLAEYMIGPGNPRYGEGAFSWLTGSADWLFVAAEQFILGIKPEFKGLLIDPCIPSIWKKCRIKRKFRNAVYDITIRNPKGVNKGVKYLIVDGKKQDSPVISAKRDNEIHKVEVIMG